MKLGNIPALIVATALGSIPFGAVQAQGPHISLQMFTLGVEHLADLKHLARKICERQPGKIVFQMKGIAPTARSQLKQGRCRRQAGIAQYVQEEPGFLCIVRHRGEQRPPGG